MDLLFCTGETSGDRHCAPVVAALRERGFRIACAGGPAMAQAGAQVLLDSTTWGGIGVPSVVRKIPRMYVAVHKLMGIVRRERPRVVVLVDAGAFNVRFAQRIARLTDRPRVLYYFPPGSWRQQPRDWSPLVAVTDLIATPFARNAEFLRASGARAHWVGHPVLDELQPTADRAALRETLGLPQGEPVIGLMSGSRITERRIIGPLLDGACDLLAEALPKASFLWSVFPDRRLSTAADRRAGSKPRLTCVEDSRAILRAADFVITAMGTATLEAAAAGTPLVGVYELTFATKFIATNVIKQLERFYAMPNLLLDREAVPEMVPADAWDRVTPRRIADAALGVLENPDRLEAMRADLATVRDMLGRPGAARRTADLIEALALDRPITEAE